jgi:hypothetical protein
MRFNPNPEGGNNERDSRYPYEDMLKSYDKSTYAWQPDMEDKILRVSKSSVGTFDWCQQQYFLEKILGMRGDEQDYHIRGSNVHDAVEYWWKAMEDVIEDVWQLVRENKREQATTRCIEALPTPPSPYIFGEDEQLHLWVKWQMDRLYTYPKEADISTIRRRWFPIGNESEVHAARIVTSSDGTDIPIHMKGYIDRIFLDDDEAGIVLMELKTGKWKDRKRADMRAEMQFYRMMLEHSQHMEFLPVSGWGWEFPGGGINGGDGPLWDYESVSGPGGRYAPKTVEKRLQKLVDAHLTGEFTPAPLLKKHDTFKCEWCDFMHECPFWKVDVNEDS